VAWLRKRQPLASGGWKWLGLQVAFGWHRTFFRLSVHSSFFWMSWLFAMETRIGKQR